LSSNYIFVKFNFHYSYFFNSDVLPSVHGSSIFQRGDTHVLCTTTLGAKENAKVYYPLNGQKDEKTEMFYLHYDFPPYCTGETGNSTGINRRMVGHGNLAERALRPVIPDITVFPYAVRYGIFVCICIYTYM
jgi:polyribonucleotide nucleotidyltransferase